MNKHLARILLLVMIISEVLGTIPVTAEASDNYTYQYVDFSVDSPENYTPDGVAMPDGGESPDYEKSSYSSVTQEKSTSVKDQDPYGSCWAFSALSVSESSVVGEGTFTSKNIDLSEMQLVNFFYHEKIDPLGNASGDKTENISDSDKLEIGGNHIFTSWALAGWLGGAPESALPYNSSNGDKVNSSSVDSSIAYSQDIVHVQNIRMIPISTEYNDMQNMKKAIVEYGGLAMGYYADGAYLKDSTYYYCNLESANHAVTIVGWNDNIPASNFSNKVGRRTITPPSNGGWLVKNSWGSDWGTDGDEDYLDSSVGGGYFWLSYYDASLLYSGVAYVFDADPVNTYQHNYQYDGSYGANSLEIDSGSYVAATYTLASRPGEEEVISAVGIGLESVNVSYSLQIYQHEDDVVITDPTTGTALLKEPITGTTDFAGFYTIPIPDEVRPSLDGGKTFSVVLRLSSSEDTVACFVDSTYTNGDWIRFTADTSKDRTWVQNESDIFYRTSDCTLRLKAYTNDAPPQNPITQVSIQGRPENNTVSYADTNRISLSAAIVPATGTDDLLVWSSSDPSVATVNQDGLLTVQNTGSAIISACSNYNNAVYDSFTLYVTQNITSIAFTSSTVTASLDIPLTLTPTVLPTNATEKIIWSSSSKSVATVDPDTGLITPRSIGTTTITAKSSSGAVQSTCVVAVKNTFKKADLGNGEFVLVFDGKAMGVEDGVLKTVSFSSTSDSSELPKGYTWTVSCNNGSYSFQNTKTGLYLRMNSSGWLFKSYTVGLGSTSTDWKISGSNGSYKLYRKPALFKRYLRYSGNSFSINTSSSSAVAFTAYQAN